MIVLNHDITIQQLFVAVLLLVASVVYGQVPDRPYEQLQFESDQGVEIPIVWYETMYDSLSATRGFDGYNSLQILERRRAQLLLDDKIISAISREGTETMGTYIECRDLLSGDLLWDHVIDTSDTDSPETHLDYAVVDGGLEVLTVRRVGERRATDLFNLTLVTDSCKAVSRRLNLNDGDLEAMRSEADSIAFIGKHTWTPVGVFSAVYKRAEDTIYYYEYDKLVHPQQVAFTTLALDGRALMGTQLLPYSDQRATVFDLVAETPETNLMFCYSGNDVSLCRVDNRLQIINSGPPLPILDVTSFVTLSILEDGSIVVLERSGPEISYHLYTSDFDYLTTVRGFSEVFVAPFVYRGTTYIMANKQLVADAGIELYRVEQDSAVLLYTWNILDNRGLTPRFTEVVGDYLYVQGNESAAQVANPAVSDRDAKAASTIVLDLSQLDLLTSTVEAIPPDYPGDLHIFPSPALVGADVTIETTESDMIRIVDSQGNIQWRSHRSDTRYLVSTAGWAAGMYFVQTLHGRHSAPLILVY